jgi:hypothetical protein
VTRLLARAAVLTLAFAITSAGGQEVQFATREQIAADARAEAWLVFVFRLTMGLWIAACIGVGVALWKKRLAAFSDELDRVRAGLHREIRAGSQELLAMVPSRRSADGADSPVWVAVLPDRLLAIDSRTGQIRSLPTKEVTEAKVIGSPDFAVSVLVRSAKSPELRLGVEHVADGVRLTEALRRVGVSLKHGRDS